MARTVGKVLTATKIYFDTDGSLGKVNKIGTITTVIDTYVVLTTDEIIICNKGTTFNVTLPEAVIGQSFTFINIGAGVVTVIAKTGGTADLINGETTQALRQWDSMTIRSYAANRWSIV
jgi:hypothetical protein